MQYKPLKMSYITLYNLWKICQVEVEVVFFYLVDLAAVYSLGKLRFNIQLAYRSLHNQSQHDRISQSKLSLVYCFKWSHATNSSPMNLNHSFSYHLIAPIVRILQSLLTYCIVVNDT